MANEKRFLDYWEIVGALGSYHRDSLTYDQKIMYDWILGEIDNAEVVDAVEVVRCKDCKHWHEETGWCNQHSHFWDDDGGFCHPWESCDWKTFDANNFCSYGERKDNGK